MATMSSRAQNAEEQVPKLFTRSKQEILDEISPTHVRAQKTFDEDSLFHVVENVLNHAIQIVDEVVQGSQVDADKKDEFPNSNLNVPVSTLKKIGCELSCKSSSEEDPHQKTLVILKELSTYTWLAKGVLALGAFALEFGDFWPLAQLQKTDQVAKSLGILKGVPNLLTPSELPERRNAVLELIKTIMKVINILNEFEKLFSYDLKDVPEAVYWAIVAIIAVSTKVSILTSDEPDKPYDLSPYANKIGLIHNDLNGKLTACKTQLAGAEAYRKIRELFQTSTEVTEFLKALLFIKDKDQPLNDGSTSRTVQIEELRRKYVFTLITSLDIPETDFSLIKQIYEKTKIYTCYAIVWIPVVEQWTDELDKKFDMLLSKMPCDVFPTFKSQISAGIRFIREDWQFKGKPMLVALNPQGRVENINAFFLLRSYGIETFPCDRKIEIEFSNKSEWIDIAVQHIDHPWIRTWIKNEKYIFFYGGKANNWIQNFETKAKALAKVLKIKIKLFCVGKTGGEDHGNDIIGKFWGAIEGFFMTKAHKQVDPVTQEIQKLLSYKNDSGWAVLSKGSTVVTTGRASTFLSVFEEFSKLKSWDREKGFEFTFKKIYERHSHVDHQCHLDLPTAPGRIPEVMNCPECRRSIFVTFKRRDVDDPAGAHH